MPAAPSEFESRRGRLLDSLAQRKLDALIVAAAPNVRYLSGFTGSNGALLVWPGGTVLFTDPRYEIQAAQETDCRVKVVRGALYPALMKFAAGKKLKKLGFEAGRLSYEAYEQLRIGLTLNASLTPVSGLVEIIRMVKSEAEIALIERSVRTNSAAFEKTMRRARPEMSESELAAEFEYQMRRLGAEKPSFDPVIAAGPRTALPHARPTASRLGRNQLLLVDVGASQDGYASDMTRMAFLGKPGAKVKRLYKAVLEAQLAALDAVRPGVRAEQVDQAARRVLRAAGLGAAFVHSTGHGLGLEIHEPPRIGRRDRTVLAAGMTITVEPGVYLEGFGGVRIEDTVVVTGSGCRILTPTSKELLLLPF
ncbi:MAG: M24 family metallopeptidase [Rhodospirillales bacterium]